MHATAKAKAVSYWGKFLKYAAVANPKLGDKFLEKIRFIFGSNHYLILHSLISLFDMVSSSSNY
jgi:hypothetical protein